MATLIGAIVALTAWIVGTFIIPVGIGLIHVLLAIGVCLMIRWWALRIDGAPATIR